MMNSEALDEIWARAEAAWFDDDFTTALGLYQRLEAAGQSRALLRLGERYWEYLPH